VNQPEGAPDNAVHGRSAAGQPPVRLSPTRARATRLSGPGVGRGSLPAITGGVRSAVELARQRWGTPVGPITGSDVPYDLDERQRADWRGDSRLASDPLRCFRIWSERPPAMAHVWADLTVGSRRVGELGWGWLVPYWAFGIPGFVVACVARFVQDAAARPGRFAAVILAVVLILVGLRIAGVI
jgi:hypothetical protein